MYEARAAQQPGREALGIASRLGVSASQLGFGFRASGLKFKRNSIQSPPLKRTLAVNMPNT